MKYLVNRETKEHYIQPGMMVPYGPQYDEVEADADGWIPWKGGECPLPEGAMCEYMLFGETQGLTEYESIESLGTSLDWIHCKNDTQNIVCYRPILETAEKEEPRRHGRTIVYIPESQKSVFDRLKSAIAASESIPDIIAEIDAMLPEGYCVVKRGAEQPAEHPAEGMTDWRNWKEGDLVTPHGLRGGYTKNAFPENVPHTIVAKCLSGFNVKSSNGDVLYFNDREISRGELKFHSRPAKVTE